MMEKWETFTIFLRNSVISRSINVIEKLEEGGDEEEDEDALLAELGEMVLF